MKPIYMSAVFVLYFCIWLLEVKAQGRDTTRIPGSSGTTVVQATVALIQESGIFPDDHQLLRRIAWVESKDGTDSQTYRQGYHGGIWQVDLIGFRDTQDTTSHPGLVSKFREIQGRLNIDWRSVQWEDLRKPLYSGLAARLFLSNVAESIPLASDVAGQASYWKRHYNTESGAGTEARFIEDVMGLEEECQIRGIDLIFVLDSSGSVGSSNFQNVRNFAANLVSQLEIGPDNTQIGMIVFSSSARVEFHLNTYHDNSSLLQAIANVQYTGGSTNTAAGLTTLLSEFSLVNGARPLQEGIPRVAIVITDGRSNAGGGPSATIAAASNIHDSNIIAYAVGVGDSILTTELNAIASDPNNQYVRLLSTFNVNELRGLQESLNSEACRASAIGEISEPFIGTLQQNQAAFFQYTLPEEGLTLRLEVEIGLIVLFASNKIRNPNEAFYDWRLETRSSADIYISLEGISSIGKRQVVQSTNTTIFVSIEGQSVTNNFTLNTTYGDTTIGDCASLMAPENGVVTDNTEIGSQANYNCEAGYYLYGGSSRTCQNDGNWTGIEPRCCINCTALNAPTYGSVTFNTTVNSPAYYTCDPGFYLAGDTSRNCQCDGNWTGMQPTCMMCEALDPPTHGSVTNNTAVNSQAIYTCNPGFALVGRSIRTCQADGTWSGEEPLCSSTQRMGTSLLLILVSLLTAKLLF